MSSHEKKSKELYARATREAMADYPRHEQNWTNLLGSVDSAYEIKQGTMYYDRTDGSSALVAEVCGDPYVFPWQEYHEAARRGLLTVFNIKRKKRRRLSRDPLSPLYHQWGEPFIHTDADIEMCMSLLFRVVRIFVRTGVAPTLGQGKPIKGMVGFCADNPTSWQRAVFNMALSVGDYYADREVRAENKWCEGAVEEYDQSKHDFTDHSLFTTEKWPLAVTPIILDKQDPQYDEDDEYESTFPFTCSADDPQGRWQELMEHPPILQIATESRDLRRYPSEKAERKANAQASARSHGRDDVDDSVEVPEEHGELIDKPMYHREWGLVTLVWHIGDTGSVVVKDKKLQDVLRADLSSKPWPKPKKRPAKKIIPFKSARSTPL